MKKTLYTVLILVLVAGVIFIFRGSNESVTNTIRIGLISSETGDFGPYGQYFSQGAQLAFEEYKVVHSNINIEMFREDDATDGKKALSAYKKLTALDKIDGLINFSSPSINIIYDLVSKLGIPVIQLGEQDIDPANDSVYQVYPTQDVPEVATGQYLKGLSNGNDTVLFYTNDSTVMKFVGNIKKGYAKEFVEEFKLDQNQKEYATIVARAMSHNPKFAVISAFTQNGSRVLLELMKYKNKPTIIFDLTYGDGTGYKAIFPDLSVLDGSYAMSLKQDLDADFIQKYKTRFNSEPTVFAGYGYDAFNTLLSGYSKDSTTWTKNINSLKLEGATGPIFFDEKGLRTPGFEMKVIKKGTLVSRD